VTDSFVF